MNIGVSVYVLRMCVCVCVCTYMCTDHSFWTYKQIWINFYYYRCLKKKTPLATQLQTLVTLIWVATWRW